VSDHEKNALVRVLAGVPADPIGHGVPSACPNETGTGSNFHGCQSRLDPDAVVCGVVRRMPVIDPAR
jgi:hypothetical protein